MEKLDLRECSDAYARVVAVLNLEWRVAVCGDGWQFLLQRRVQRNPEKAWQSVKFFAGASHLRTRVREMAGEIEPEAARILAALPERAAMMSLTI
ncbi:hypothetical protein [Xanthobacter versatilis]|uniref:hypothetical protein n=1 Tax=Xanthobacter autotrophicus (strain ATCC BAA-1158 / Py2) TaxID=78245 RepID=UPI003728D551